MKRHFCVVLSIFLLLAASAYAESFDFSSYDTQTLSHLDVAIRNELSKRYISNTASLIPAETYNGEILFRGIAWGTNVDTAKSSLIGSGFFSGKCEVESEARLIPWSLDPEDADSYWESGYRLYQYTFADEAKVAGYSVDSVNLYFMYSHNGSKSNKETSAAELYLVSMELETADYDLAYADLLNKLSSLYGTATESSDVTGYWSTGGDYHQYDWWASWYGSNDTAVLLHMTYDITDEDQKTKGEELKLYYGKTNSEARLVSLSNTLTSEAKALEQEKIVENANNTDGL